MFRGVENPLQGPKVFDQLKHTLVESLKGQMSLYQTLPTINCTWKQRAHITVSADIKAIFGPRGSVAD